MVLGEGPAPSLVLALIQRLPADSLTLALVNGNRKHFGWTPERYLLADIYDVINLNTRATGMWKGKAPEFPLQPRPYDTPSSEGEPKPKLSVKNLYNRFTGGL